MIGIKPQFGGDEVEEGAIANLDVDPRRARRASASPRQGLVRRLERIVSDYQWYRTDGRWNYEIDHQRRARRRPATIDAKADGPVTRLGAMSTGAATASRVERVGDRRAASSYEFYAGWYVVRRQRPRRRTCSGRPRQAGLPRRRHRPSSGSTRASPASR